MRQKTVLVAEDDPQTLQLLSRLLKSRGYNSLLASDGDVALALFEQHRDAIDLLLFDVLMPRMDGYTCAKQIRAQRPDLPVLFISGYSNEDMNEQIATWPRCVFVSKPLHIALLATQLDWMFLSE